MVGLSQTELETLLQHIIEFKELYKRDVAARESIAESLDLLAQSTSIPVRVVND